MNNEINPTQNIANLKSINKTNIELKSTHIKNIAGNNINYFINGYIGFMGFSTTDPLINVDNFNQLAKSYIGEDDEKVQQLLETMAQISLDLANGIIVTGEEFKVRLDEIQHIIGSENMVGFLAGIANYEDGLSIITDYSYKFAYQVIENRYVQNSQVVGRKDAYQDTDTGEISIIRNPITFENEHYEVHNISALKANGSIDRSLLAKIHVPQKVDPNAEEVTVHIGWRGSQTKESWTSDLQRCPGFDSFFSHEEEIMRDIATAIESAHNRFPNKPINIMISGHSLGGALAQQNVLALQRAICRGIDSPESVELNSSYNTMVEQEMLNSGYMAAHDLTSGDILQQQSRIDKVSIPPGRIKAIHLGIHNSAGVLGITADACNNCAQYLHDAHQTQHYVHATMNQGDAVQLGGEATVLADLEKSQANIEVFYNQYDTRAKVSPAVRLALPSSLGMSVGGTVAAISTGGMTLPFIAGAAAFVCGAAAISKGAADAHRHSFVDDNGLEVNQGNTSRHHYSSESEEGRDIVKLHLINNKSGVVQQAGNLLRAVGNKTGKSDLLGNAEDLKVKNATESQSATIMIGSLGGSKPDLAMSEFRSNAESEMKSNSSQQPNSTKELTRADVSENNEESVSLLTFS